jgi:hypothetical protein
MTRCKFGAQRDLFAPSRSAAGLTPAQIRILVPLIEALLAEVAAADPAMDMSMTRMGAGDEDHA